MAKVIALIDDVTGETVGIYCPGFSRYLFYSRDRKGNFIKKRFKFD